VEEAMVPLAEFELTGLDEVKAKYVDTCKISAHFRCGCSVLCSVYGSQSVLAVSMWVSVNTRVRVGCS